MYTAIHRFFLNSYQGTTYLKSLIINKLHPTVPYLILLLALPSDFVSYMFQSDIESNILYYRSSLSSITLN